MLKNNTKKMLNTFSLWRKHIYRKELNSFLDLYSENCILLIQRKNNINSQNRRISVFREFFDFFDKEKCLYVPEPEMIQDEKLYTLSGNVDFFINDEEIKTQQFLIFEPEQIKGYYPYDKIKKEKIKMLIKYHHINFDV